MTHPRITRANLYLQVEQTKANHSFCIFLTDEEKKTVVDGQILMGSKYEQQIWTTHYVYIWQGSMRLHLNLPDSSNSINTEAKLIAHINLGGWLNKQTGFSFKHTKILIVALVLIYLVLLNDLQSYTFALQLQNLLDCSKTEKMIWIHQM